MLWHPFLLLVRKRLIATAILSLVAPLVAVSSGNFRSLGPINFLLGILVGGFLGWNSAGNRAAATRFLFTRPIPRLAVLLRPLMVAAFALIVFRLPTFLLLAGCLCLPAPVRSQFIGLPPSPLQVLATFASSCLAGVLAGLIAYAVMASKRLIVLSPKWLQSLIRFSALFFVLPLLFWGLRPPKQAGFGSIVAALTYPPSALLIVWPFLFAAMVLYCCWRIVQGIDELPESDHSAVAMRVNETIRAMRAARDAK